MNKHQADPKTKYQKWERQSKMGCLFPFGKAMMEYQLFYGVAGETVLGDVNICSMNYGNSLV